MARSRNVLCVAPRYATSFGTFDHAFHLVGARAFMPPQGLLVIAARLPASWRVRLIDENVRPVTDDDLRWADAVFVTGMHVQRDRIMRLVERAHAWNRLTVLGGPSVSACPDWYPEADILHLGELGDATDAVIARVERDVTRPPTQERYRTKDRLPLDRFPIPAYGTIDLRDYFLASVQFSSGCPFSCEFCDIPALYGHTPRMKTPQQVTAELDTLMACGSPRSVYFVDDNFVANPHAATALLPELVRWQERNGYPLVFACEATLNITKRPELLRLMRQARFTTMFAGVESPDTDALHALNKRQNLRSPILDGVRTLNAHGIEVVAGIIIGLDTDTPASYDRLVHFIDTSAIPLLTINLLHALPGTPLWDRLEKAGRILTDPGTRESNVDFLLPYPVVLDGWRRTIRHAYAPHRLYSRFQHQMHHTYPNRLAVPRRPSRADLHRGLEVVGRTLWECGVRAPYRREFWRMARSIASHADLEGFVQTAVVGHHLITYAREALDGRAEKAFYAPRH
ncbi:MULTISPECIES: B12-binding domain-containing radical SAM protein [Streptomyces]|uniref:B12-binding domain-containing radical SAM protein n=1 Tax=Streptomyces TaxID=1883 RepID=UPI0014879919|nr:MULTISPECIES: B12-binding domain-containing radical SAM protein [Streptomyces]